MTSSDEGSAAGEASPPAAPGPGPTPFWLQQPALTRRPDSGQAPAPGAAVPAPPAGDAAETAPGAVAGAGPPAPPAWTPTDPHQGAPGAGGTPRPTTPPPSWSPRPGGASYGVGDVPGGAAVTDVLARDGRESGREWSAGAASDRARGSGSGSGVESGAGAGAGVAWSPRVGAAAVASSAAAASAAGSAPTRALPRPEAKPGSASPAGATRRVAASSGGPRRARLALRRVDPWSVLKFALIASICMAVVGIIAVAVLYAVISGLGVFDSIARFVDTVTDVQQGKSIRRYFTAGTIIGGASIFFALTAVLSTALATLASFVYNLCASFTGGIEVTLTER